MRVDFFLVGGDVRLVFERQADIVEPLQQHVLAERIDLEVILQPLDRR